MKKAYIVGAKRSAIGSFMGGLTNANLVELGATVLKETIQQAQIDPAHIDEVLVGNVIAAGLGQNIGRQVSIAAGIPVEVCAQSINMLCGSGLKAVMEATIRIQAGFGDIFVAGGVESMTNAPFLIPSKIRNGVKMGDMKLVDSMLHDGLTDGMYGIHMGVTADNIASKYNISREDQDAFAFASQQKAIAAIDSGRFKDEIVPIEIPGRKGSVTIFDTDEHPNRASTLEKLAKLRPAFNKEGSVTAGNASGINDGASFTIVVSEDALKKYNLTPLAEIIGMGQGGVDPRVMGLGPTPAILNALKYADMKLDDMELVELNEAFSAQSLGVIHELEEATHMDRNAFLEKTNVNGGAIALGHPVGASGNRILVTLLYEMQKRDVKVGLATLCIGGGQGAALIVKRP
ncbi:MAG: acetyl-CoA C-acetyltransferase [Longicatena sp.]